MHRLFNRVALGTVLAIALAGCAGRQMLSAGSLPTGPRGPFHPGRENRLVRRGPGHRVYVGGPLPEPPPGQRAREIVLRLNRTLPALDTRASLAAFSAGSCLSCDDAEVLYGPAPSTVADFEARGDAVLRCRRRASAPADPVIDQHASGLILRDSPGRVA